MNEPQQDSRGDSIASASHLTELAERASGKIGVVDTDHPRELYLRTVGSVADRFPLLANLKSRYDAGHDAHQHGQSVAGLAAGTTEVVAPDFAHTVRSSERVSRQGEDSVSQSGPSSTPPVTYRVSRRPSYQALAVDRAMRGGVTPVSSAPVEPDSSVKEPGPQPGLAQEADMNALSVALPIAAQDRESEKQERSSVKISGVSAMVQRLDDLILSKGDNGSPAQLENREAPLILRQPATGKPDATRTPLPVEVTNRDFAATSEDPGLSNAPDPGDTSRMMINGAEAGQPGIVAPRAPDLPADTIAPVQVSRSVEPLVLRKARVETGEVAFSEEPVQSKEITINEQGTVRRAALEPREGLTAPRLAAEAISRKAVPSESSPAGARAAVSTPSLPLVKAQTSPAVQPKRLDSNRAEGPSFGGDSGPLIAREIRAAPRQSEAPNIVWRQSFGARSDGRSRAPDTTIMLNASRSFRAATEGGSSSSGSLNNSQSWTPQLPEANQSPSIDVGRITEQIVRAIQRRLELERERRGMGR